MKKQCIAMLLAGGQGSRLLSLTKNIAKPAVSFAGKYRIIDFSLSNCANSHISTVGVLTQYRPLKLHSYIGTGAAWNLDVQDGGVFILPPYETEKGGTWYSGTASAVYQNIDFIEMNDPEMVIILSGDHIYRMDYQEMIAAHKAHNADLTVSVMTVPWEDTSRFGILTTDENDMITKFSEKPKEADSNLASMGIYVFNTKALLKALREDAQDPNSDNDFGKNIIPNMLAEGKRLHAYTFKGFWKDVGTIASYYETSMALLDENPEFDIFSTTPPIMCNENTQPAQYCGPNCDISDCLVANGTEVDGTAEHCILSVGSYIGEGAVVRDSILFPGAYIEAGATVDHAILGEGAIVKAGASISGSDAPAESDNYVVVDGIAVVGNNVVIGE